MLRLAEEGRHFEMSSSDVNGALYLGYATPWTDVRAVYAGADLLDQGLVARRHQYYGGNRPFDVIWAEIYPLFSSRVIALLHAVGATGWKAVPVRCEGVETPLDYFAIVVLGRGGPVRMVRGESRVVREGSDWVVAQGACFDADEWDGSDVWGPEGAVVPFVTRRIVDAFVAAKVRGIRFTDFRPLERNLSRTDFEG